MSGSWSGSTLPQVIASCGVAPLKAAGVGAGVGDLQEVIVAALVQAEHFLNLRLRLQHEVLGRAAAEDEHAAAALSSWRPRRWPPTG